MAPDADPHRTLGLRRDASPAEIKAAYRRLAKAFHPDAAGDAAIPRFLAIQAAYEQLTGISPASGRAARDAWRADPDRARATRDAWRGRRAGGAGSAGSGGGSAGTAGPDAGGDGSGADAGAGAWREKRRDAGPKGRRTGGAAAGEDATRRRTRRSSAADRAPDRATPGSTTYDFADQEPFDPEWSGASWYGTTSGTYWTINPKEYADPRKHGPEYQARGRRRPAVEPNATEPAAADAEEAAAEPREEEPVAWAANAAAAGGPPPASRARQGAWVPPTVPLRGRTARR